VRFFVHCSTNFRQQSKILEKRMNGYTAEQHAHGNVVSGR
jgi:hypothetical protein